MAEFFSVCGQNRHQLVVFRFKLRVGIDVKHLDIKRKLAAQILQRSEHVVA